MSNDIKIFLNRIIPKVHNLKNVIYVRWLDRD